MWMRESHGSARSHRCAAIQILDLTLWVESHARADCQADHGGRIALVVEEQLIASYAHGILGIQENNSTATQKHLTG